jgi:hypothetical protein
MTDPAKQRQFSCEGKRWIVVRRTAAQSRQAGLYFHSDGDTRFLAFTHGALPSDGGLQLLSEEVLCVLLRRSVLQ